MVRHYYTLLKLAESFRSFIGCQIVECFSQDKDSVILELFNGRDSGFIHFSADGKNACIFSTPNYSRAKKNTVDLFSGVIGDRIQSVDLIEGNRIIRIGLINSDLYFYLFGGSRSNLIAVDKQEIIIDALNNLKNLRGTRHVLNFEQAPSIKSFDKEKSILYALSNSNALLGKYYAREFCFIKGIDPDNSVGNYAEAELDDFGQELLKFRMNCLSSQEFLILENERHEIVLSLIPLQSHKTIIRSFQNISEAVSLRIYDLQAHTSISDLQRKILTSAEKLKIKLEREISQVEDSSQTLERAEKYREWAELLLTSPDNRQKSGSNVILKHWDGRIIDIPLDPSLNLGENSDKYFSKARQARRSLEERKMRLPRLLDKYKAISRILIEAEGSSDLKDLKRIKESFQLITGMKMDSKEIEQPDRFRKFDLGGGYTVFVGKSAANNDELTMKFARPNDIWLHARGTGGSHCVLRGISGQKIPKDMLRKAAEIAAYYSQAKNAKYTPVSYTPKKYVRKPKGANPGSVVIAREEVIMVEPKLPENQEGN